MLRLSARSNAADFVLISVVLIAWGEIFIAMNFATAPLAGVALKPMRRQ